MKYHTAIVKCRPKCSKWPSLMCLMQEYITCEQNKYTINISTVAVFEKEIVDEIFGILFSQL